ncbi:Pre protein translocase subunit Sec66-domain-containing protein [Lentinula raphanica]|nr:Pre protein translocase subunit Sec66-domain-containing protein [Lentinula raphanica]
MASVLVPVAYILVVFGGLFIFSFYYRKQAASRVLEPYFPSHPERNTYVTLLQKTDPPTPEVVLKSALLRRAMADVQRVIRLREDKPAVQNLMQKGSVGDDLWNSLLAAEKEMEAEIIEVMNEANTFVEGWGPVIFPSANEIIANEKMRSVFEHTADRKAELGMCRQTDRYADLGILIVSLNREKIWSEGSKHTYYGPCDCQNDPFEFCFEYHCCAKSQPYTESQWSDRQYRVSNP